MDCGLNLRSLDCQSFQFLPTSLQLINEVLHSFKLSLQHEYYIPSILHYNYIMAVIHKTDILILVSLVLIALTLGSCCKDKFIFLKNVIFL